VRRTAAGWFALVAALGISTAVGAGTPDVPAGYVVFQTVALDARESGIDGALEVLQDARLTDKFREAWGASSDFAMVLKEDDPLFISAAHDPLKSGRLRLVDNSGHVLSEEVFTVPLGKIDIEHLYGTKFPSYLVSIDYGRGYGSHSGPVTKIVEIRKGKLETVQVRDAETGKVAPLKFGWAVRDGWQIVPNGKGGKEIETLSSDPDPATMRLDSNPTMRVRYARYFFAGGQWHMRYHYVEGYWEGEGDWPNRAAFR
jgi:hypothetical protein